MIQLIHGDCTKIQIYQKVDLFLADLPYGTTACKWDIIIPFDILWKLVDTVLKPNGTVALFNTEPFGSLLRVSNLKDYKYDWIWQKNTGTNFFHAKRMPIRYSENIAIFQKSAAHYNPQKTTGHIPTNSGIGRNTGNIYHGKNKVDYQGGDTTRFPQNILKFNTVDNYHRLHSTQKPVDLVEYLIKTYTNENDTVFDPVMGSGTTGVACKNLNRCFIGIEVDKEYFDIAVKRYNEG